MPENKSILKDIAVLAFIAYTGGISGFAHITSFEVLKSCEVHNIWSLGSYKINGFLTGLCYLTFQLGLITLTGVAAYDFMLAAQYTLMTLGTNIELMAAIELAGQALFHTFAITNYVIPAVLPKEISSFSFRSRKAEVDPMAASAGATPTTGGFCLIQ